MKFHHHAMGAGVVMGVLLTTHAWLLVTVGLVGGWIARDLYSVARWTAQAIAHRRAKRPGTRHARIPY